MTTPSPEELAEQLRPALTKLYVKYFRIAEQSRLTGPQLSMMTRMKEMGGVRISRLAQDEGIRTPTVSNALHQLEKRGLIERTRDPVDKRGVLVRVTPHGERLLEEVGAERTAYLTKMLSALPPEYLAKAAEIVDVITTLEERFISPTISHDKS